MNEGISNTVKAAKNLPSVNAQSCKSFEIYPKVLSILSPKSKLVHSPKRVQKEIYNMTKR